MKLIVSTFLVYKVKKCLQKSGKVSMVSKPSCPSLAGGSLPYTQALNPYHRD
jgi:hypothetical protein